MQHTANMTVRSMICSGLRVSDAQMTDADRDWANKSNVIRMDNNRRWYHTGNTERSNAAYARMRAEFWNPDTGPWRKGVNY